MFLILEVSVSSCAGEGRGGGGLRLWGLRPGGGLGRGVNEG